MLSQAENEYLCRIGPGTPMGTLLRRFWLPALISTELPEPDGAPIRLKLMSEQLVAFRDTTGKVGIVQNNCPHRGASLFFGRNEESGLRCVYHGWKFDASGACVDMPNEPAESDFKQKVTATAYPTEEAGGVIWVYMGPAETRPPLPRPEWTLVPPEQRIVSRYIQENNWVQGLEGGIDSSHVSFLHSTVASHKGDFTGSSTNLFALDKSPEFRVVETDFGLLIGARRRVSDSEDYWRVTPFSLPFYTVIPQVPGQRPLLRRTRLGADRRRESVNGDVLLAPLSANGRIRAGCRVTLRTTSKKTATRFVRGSLARTTTLSTGRRSGRTLTRASKTGRSRIERSRRPWGRFTIAPRSTSAVPTRRSS